MDRRLSARLPVQGLLRRLLRLPIWFYRLRLGWLLGDRFLMLTHIGRKSRMPRQTVLEVVHHDIAAETYYVASGWGERSDWLQNVLRTPRVLIDAGRRRYAGQAVRLTSDQALEILVEYARRHRGAFRALAKLILGETPDNDDAAIERMAHALPMIALRPDER